MDPELEQRLNQIEAKVDQVYRTSLLVRKIILWTVIGTIVMFIVPLIGIAIVLPSFLQTYNINAVLNL